MSGISQKIFEENGSAGKTEKLFTIKKERNCIVSSTVLSTVLSTVGTAVGTAVPHTHTGWLMMRSLNR